MKGKVSMDELFKSLHNERPESSWCRTCIKHDKCNIKEEVAFEEHCINIARKTHLKVRYECSEYINDPKLKDIKKDLLQELGFRSYRK